MKRFFLFLFLLVSTISCSCSPVTSSDGSDFIWRVPLFSGQLITLVLRPMVYNKNVLFVGDKSGKTTLLMVDISTGQSIWEWSDFFLSRENILPSEQYLYGDNYSLQTKNGLYGINLTTGKTIYKTMIRQGGSDDVRGIGKVFFSAINAATIIQGDMETGKIIPIYSFPSENGFNIYAQSPVPIIIQNIDTLLIVSWLKFNISNSNAFSRLALFNLTKHEFVYDTARPSELGSGGLPVVYNNKVYQDIGHSLVCNELFTGRQIWRKDFTNSFLFSGYTIAEGKFFAANEDLNFYTLDAETGQEIWRKDGIVGGTRTPFFMNGVIYFISGNDGLLWAINASSGNIIWKKSAPDNTYFYGRVGGANGKIFVNSRQHGYCYKSAQ